jgi:hypothetical protein
MKKGEQFGRSISKIFMRLVFWFSFWLPTRSRIRFGLVRPSFIFISDRHPDLFTALMGLLNQVFFGVVSGSVTITLPRLRLRTT